MPKDGAELIRLQVRLRKAPRTVCQVRSARSGQMAGAQDDVVPMTVANGF